MSFSNLKTFHVCHICLQCGRFKGQCRLTKEHDSFLLLVAMPFAPSSVLAPSSKARSP